MYGKMGYLLCWAILYKNLWDKDTDKFKLKANNLVSGDAFRRARLKEAIGAMKKQTIYGKCAGASSRLESDIHKLPWMYDHIKTLLFLFYI